MSQPRVHITDPQITNSKNTPGFYSDNTFQIFDPYIALNWLDVITPSNVQKIHKLWIFVHAVYNPGPYPDFLTNKPPNGPRWRELLGRLFAEAQHLKEMTLYLDSEPTVNHWGPALDVEFVRTLGKFSNLEKLEIMGYFPKEWPEYLERMTGLKVWHEAGQEKQYLSSLEEFQENFHDQII